MVRALPSHGRGPRFESWYAHQPGKATPPGDRGCPCPRVCCAGRLGSCPRGREDRRKLARPFPGCCQRILSRASDNDPVQSTQNSKEPGDEPTRPSKRTSGGSTGICDVRTTVLPRRTSSPFGPFAAPEVAGVERRRGVHRDRRRRRRQRGHHHLTGPGRHPGVDDEQPARYATPEAPTRCGGPVLRARSPP